MIRVAFDTAQFQRPCRCGISRRPCYSTKESTYLNDPMKT